MNVRLADNIYMSGIGDVLKKAFQEYQDTSSVTVAPGVKVDLPYPGTPPIVPDSSNVKNVAVPVVPSDNSKKIIMYSAIGGGVLLLTVLLARKK